jgi:hypothetical protein
LNKIFELFRRLKEGIIDLDYNPPTSAIDSFEVNYDILTETLIIRLLFMRYLSEKYHTNEVYAKETLSKCENINPIDIPGIIAENKAKWNEYIELRFKAAEIIKQLFPKAQILNAHGVTESKKDSSSNLFTIKIKSRDE